MLEFYPLNRHSLSTPLEEEPPPGQVLLPDDYKAVKRYERYCVLDVSEDVSLEVDTDDVIVVEESMVQPIEINGQTSYLILENYVLGIVRSE